MANRKANRQRKIFGGVGVMVVCVASACGQQQVPTQQVPPEQALVVEG